MSTSCLRVLLVEDNENNAEFVKFSLADADLTRFKVEHVGCLADAQRSLEERDYDVVLLDLGLPDATGYEALVRIRDQRPEISIVALTSDSNPDAGTEAGAVGAHDYLYKGDLSARALERVLRHAVHRQKMFLELRDLNSELERKKRELHSTDELLDRSNTDRQTVNRLLDSKHAQLENANDLLDQKNNQLQTTNDQLAQKNVALLAANHALDRSNEDLQLAMTKLTEKNTELTEFTYIASHDLQEPVRKMISFGQLLREDAGNNLPQIAQEDLSRIVDAANRMNCLIQDLLRLSRTGAAAMRNENVPIRCCIDDALDLLSETIAERSAEIECCEYFPTVTGDSTMLTQVFQNLISNALKFTKAEQPRIEITAEQDGDSWILGVRDNGIGISQENAETIFKPFKRLHSRDEYSGTGIGLSICKKAVNRHGGEIWIESGENGGTHFKFKLQETQTAEASGPLSLQEC